MKPNLPSLMSGERGNDGGREEMSQRELRKELTVREKVENIGGEKSVNKMVKMKATRVEGR